MDEIRCPRCGEPIGDELIDRAVEYAHDVGFDEGYEAAVYELGEDGEKTDGRVHAED